jgi:hypothetical protein
MSGTSQGRTTNFDGKLLKQQSYFDWLGKRNVSWAAYYQDDPWAIMYVHHHHHVSLLCCTLNGYLYVA